MNSTTKTSEIKDAVKILQTASKNTA